MEGCEIVVCKEKLQMWIQEKVKRQLISSGVLEKYNVLQSLLKRREEQATRIQELCKTVAAFEAVVKRQYTLLGLEYKESDSEEEEEEEEEEDDDEETKSIGNTAPPEFVCVQSGNKAPSSPATKPLLLKHGDSKSPCVSLTQKPVVALTRLSCHQPIRSVCLPAPQSSCSGSESFSDPDSDSHWEPGYDTSDSEYSVSSYGSRKRRKINFNDEKRVKRRKELKARRTKGAKTPQTSTGSSAKKGKTSTSSPNATVNTKSKTRSNKEKTLKSPAGAIVDTKSNTASTPQTSTKSSGKVRKTSTTSPFVIDNTKSPTEKTLTSAVGATVNMKGNTEKTSTSPINTKGFTPSKKRHLCQTSAEATNIQASNSQVELSVNMEVLARKSAMKWLHAKILEIIPTDDKLRYRVSFEDKKKIVSGHHIALTSPPKVEQLSVGCRVVIKCDPPIFSPGTLAEMPARRNNMRFLVFTDDHKPRYVGLPLFHLVFRPLKDPLDDIPDGSHKDFMRDYVRSWPYPSQTCYRVGQILEAEHENVQQKCKVLEVNCSLIHVVFEKDQHQEWLYRGSMRLQHMINMQEQLLEPKGYKSRRVKESSKSTNWKQRHVKKSGRYVSR